MHRIFRNAIVSVFPILPSIFMLLSCGGGGLSDAGVSAAVAAAGNARATIQSVSTLTGDAATPGLTVRAKADLAAGVAAMLAVRAAGNVVGTVEVRNNTFSDYNFAAPSLVADSNVDIVVSNDAVITGQDGNHYVACAACGDQRVFPIVAGSFLDLRAGAVALDGLNVLPGQGAIYLSGVLRLIWPATRIVDVTLPAKIAAVRLLLQTTFGPTDAEIARVSQLTPVASVDKEIALPFTPNYVNAVQARYIKGDAWPAGGPTFDAG